MDAAASTKKGLITAGLGLLLTGALIDAGIGGRLNQAALLLGLLLVNYSVSKGRLGKPSGEPGVSDK